MRVDEVLLIGVSNCISIVEQSNEIITYIQKEYLIGGRILLHITPWTLINVVFERLFIIIYIESCQETTLGWTPLSSYAPHYLLSEMWFESLWFQLEYIFPSSRH
jgi:hypothetical protein